MSRRLIEEWLPIAEIGIESVRERTPMTPFPAPNRLHVWWARRPLVAARPIGAGKTGIQGYFLYFIREITPQKLRKFVV